MATFNPMPMATKHLLSDVGSAVSSVVARILRCAMIDVRSSHAGLSKFPKTTLQYEGHDDEHAMLVFLENRNY